MKNSKITPKTVQVARDPSKNSDQSKNVSRDALGMLSGRFSGRNAQKQQWWHGQK